MLKTSYNVKILAERRDIKKGEEGTLISVSDDSAIVIVSRTGQITSVRFDLLQVGQKCKACGEWNNGVGGKYCNVTCAIAATIEETE